MGLQIQRRLVLATRIDLYQGELKSSGLSGSSVFFAR